MFGWRGAISWIIGGVVGYAIIWASTGELKLRGLAVFVAAGLFVHFAAWVFKSVEREPVGGNSVRNDDDATTKT